MREIQLSKGLVALVDDEDFDRINALKWSASYSRTSNTFYAHSKVYLGGGRANTQSKTLCMHRLVMRTPANQFVDHKDGNGLNNTKANLRNCTRSENTRNKRKLKAGTSIFKGVSWDSSNSKWKARITVDKRVIQLGRFNSEREASIAYNNAALIHHKEFANLNVV